MFVPDCNVMFFLCLLQSTMSVPISSLASLTATYTDSEGEDEHEHEEHQPGVKVGTVVLTEESSLSKPPTPSAPAVKRKRTNVKRLVSYQDDHDDTYVTTEEEGEASEGDEEHDSDMDNNGNAAAPLDETENSPEAKMQAELEAKASAAAAHGVRLPDEPKGKCSAELQDKINKFYDKMISGGLDMNRVIQQRKDFRNPSIYEKLIQYCKINELGTNYPTEYYDPLRWGKESFYEELAKVQKTEMDKREKERKDKAKVEIVMGTAKRTTTTTTSVITKTAQSSASVIAAQALGVAEEAKRKSKWDQVGGSQQPPQPTALTANITGTKSTVISAFGSLPKRPRI